VSWSDHPNWTDESINPLSKALQLIKRTAHMLVVRRDVRVNHRRLDVLVPKQCLDGSDIRACCQQVARKTVPQRIRPHMLVDFCLLHSMLECPPKRTGRRMPSCHLLAIELGPNHSRGEYKLPSQTGKLSH
jgi:hypothetical protein